MCFFQDEATPYSFFVNEFEITENIGNVLKEQNVETEKTIEIVYQPQAVFRVRSVSRCSSTISG